MQNMLASAFGLVKNRLRFHHTPYSYPNEIHSSYIAHIINRNDTDTILHLYFPFSRFFSDFYTFKCSQYVFQ